VGVGFGPNLSADTGTTWLGEGDGFIEEDTDEMVRWEGKGER